MNKNTPAITSLRKEFTDCIQKRFNGVLEWQNNQGTQWRFYYCLGRIVWVTGGVHPVRRLFRTITQNCPEISTDKIKLYPEDLSSNYWDYKIIERLNKSKIINVITITVIVDSIIKEVLFELIQEASNSLKDIQPSLIFKLNEREVLDIPITLTSGELFEHQMDTAIERWKKWEAASLGKISLNYAPVISQPKQLKEQPSINELIYKAFVNLINGKHTLADLSVKMEQDVLPLTKSLLPYLKQGIIKLAKIPDLSIPTEARSCSITDKFIGKEGPVIACVDDSPQVCQILERILTGAGYRFIGIQDSVQALGILIENKPDLIFLDLIMPVANGYELCSQIRRVSSLAETPVIILTGSDGLVDRVRAKMVGATNFLGKPIEKEKLLTMVQKYV